MCIRDSHQSIRELATLAPTVQTIAVVPVGLTKYRFEGKRPQSIRSAIHIHETPEWIDTNWERQPLWDETQHTHALEMPALSPAADLGYCARQIVSTDVPMRVYTPEEAARVVDLVEAYQPHMRALYGTNMVYASDEFYLLCGRDMPPADRYDGMPQYSNLSLIHI